MGKLTAMRERRADDLRDFAKSEWNGDADWVLAHLAEGTPVSPKPEIEPSSPPRAAVAESGPQRPSSRRPRRARRARPSVSPLRLPQHREVARLGVFL